MTPAADRPAPLTGRRILVTGATGWVGGPLAAALAAAGHQVFGAARFADPAARRPLERAGVATVAVDLAAGAFDDVPADLDLVVHLAVTKSTDFAAALRVNAEASGELMDAVAARSPRLGAFLHCSSTAVYEPVGPAPRHEDDPLGDSHRPMPGMATYSIAKIAAEAVVRAASRRLGLPTVIARLSVPYGDTYGWPLFHLALMERGLAVPVHADGPSCYAPIHADDITASLPYLLTLAAAPATTVNWGGDDVVSIEQWCAHLGDLTGLAVTFAPTTATIASIVPDLTKLRATGFRSAVPWRDGLARMVAASRPHLIRNPSRPPEGAPCASA